MFNKNFYPTPPELIEIMLEPYYKEYDGQKVLELSNKYVLEPSAGKGDIIDFIQENTESSYGFRGGTNPDKIYYFEKEPDLQKVLLDKDAHFLGSDFLTETTNLNFDLIIMNPPFDQGAKHLLKAWETIQNGDIVCLLNAETLNNPHTKERERLLSIIEDNGTYEIIDNAFLKSERSTSVSTALVRLTKVSEEKTYFNNDQFDFSEKQELPNFESQSLEVTDAFTQWEARYNECIEIYKKLAYYKSKFETICKPLYKYSMDELKEPSIKNYNNFIQSFNTKCWDTVLSETSIRSKMSSRVERDFMSKFASQKDMNFTKQNMINLFEILWNKQDDIFNDSLIDVFDDLTRYHDENREGIEGFKTNDAYKLNKKVILTSVVKYGDYMSQNDLSMYGDKFSTNYTYRQGLRDFEMILNRLQPSSESYISVNQALERKFDQLGKVKSGTFDNKTESTFFNIKFFKKGTIHLTFKDDFLYQEFNRRVCELKGYPLPEKTTDKKNGRDRKRKAKPMHKSDKATFSDSNFQGVLSFINRTQASSSL